MFFTLDGSTRSYVNNAMHNPNTVANTITESKIMAIKQAHFRRRARSYSRTCNKTDRDSSYFISRIVITQIGALIYFINEGCLDKIIIIFHFQVCTCVHRFDRFLMGVHSVVKQYSMQERERERERERGSCRESEREREL